MVKARQARAKVVQKKLKRLQKSEEHEEAAPSSEGPAPSLKTQRKLTKKVKFLQRVAASKPALAVKTGVGKKKKRKPSTLADLSTLVEGLKDASQLREKQLAEQEEQQHKPGQGVGTLRARARVLEQESVRLQQVLHHPQFLADPLAAIKNHLTATLPAAPAQEVKKRGGAGPGEVLSRYEKKKRQKANRAAAAAMIE